MYNLPSVSLILFIGISSLLEISGTISIDEPWNCESRKNKLLCVHVDLVNYNIIINYKTKFSCTGVKEFGTSNFHCWAKNGHGNLNLMQAIEQSCDVFFYELGLKVGIDKIAIMMKKARLRIV